MRRLWSRLKFTLRLYSGLYLDVRRGRAAGALQESQGLVTSLRGRHLFHSIHTLLFKKIIYIITYNNAFLQQEVRSVN